METNSTLNCICFRCLATQFDLHCRGWFAVQHYEICHFLVYSMLLFCDTNICGCSKALPYSCVGISVHISLLLLPLDLHEVRDAATPRNHMNLEEKNHRLAKVLMMCWSQKTIKSYPNQKGRINSRWGLYWCYINKTDLTLLEGYSCSPKHEQSKLSEWHIWTMLCWLQMVFWHKEKTEKT